MGSFWVREEGMMGKYAKVLAALLFVASLLLISTGVGQVPDDFDIYSIRTPEDLAEFRLLFEDPTLQSEIRRGFAIGPCKSFALARVDIGRGKRKLLYGALGFGDPASPEEYRVFFLFYPIDDRTANLWIKAENIGVAPGATVIFENQISFSFLLHVLNEMPDELVVPLNHGSISELRAEHRSGKKPVSFLYVTYGDLPQENDLTISARVLSENPPRFGSLIFD